MSKKTEIKRANAEMLMARFRAEMAAAEAAIDPIPQPVFMTRAEFQAMQENSPNVELHTVLPPELEQRRRLLR